MASNNKEFLLKYKASSEGFEKILKEVVEIQKTSGAIFDKSMLEQIRAAETRFSLLRQKIAELEQDDSRKIDIIDLQSFDKMFDNLDKRIVRLITDVSKLGLAPNIAEQLDEITKKIEKAKEDLEKTVKNFRNLRGLNVKGQLTQDRQQAIFEQVSGGEPLQIGSRKVTNWQTVSKAVDDPEQQEKYLKYQELILKTKKAIAKEELRLKNIRKKGEDSIESAKSEIAILENTRDRLLDLSKAEKEHQPILNKTTQLFADATKAKEDYNRASNETNKEFKETQHQGAAVKDTMEKQDGTFKKAAKQVFSYGIIIGTLKKTLKTTINTITEMDRALTGMAVVTSMTREEAWKLVGTWQDLARQTGLTSTEIAGMATKYFQQGKQLSQVIKLTEAAAKAARIAGISGEESINLLTNAMNAFRVSADDALSVSDKFAALAASSATDFEELAIALSKVASQAHAAGMSMDFTLGLLAKGVEVTRESPETIGTALKTVIARMRELTDYGKTLEDGMDVNRVAKALTNIGVDLMDPITGQFRELDAVITDVGKKWDTLNTNQQANVAVALAGSRQQSRLIAMMQDFDRTLELVDISANSYGATMAQHAKFMGGMEAATTKLKNSYEQLITAITSSEVIIGVISALGSVISVVADNSWVLVSALTAAGIIMGINAVTTAISTAAIIKKNLATVISEKATGRDTAANTINNLVEKGGIITKLMAAIAIRKKAKANNSSTKATVAETVAQWNLNAAMYAFPVVAVAIAILALIAALVLLTVWLVKSTKNSKDMGKAVERTTENLDQLHAKLYELNQSANTVASLADEFENLVGKVIKSREETERLVEIVKEINELSGKDVVNLQDRYEDQLTDIRNYQKSQELLIRGTVKSMNATLAAGYDDIQKTALKKHTNMYYTEGAETTTDWAGNIRYIDRVAMEADIQDSMEQLLKTASARNAIRAFTQENIAGLRGSHEETKHVINDMIFEMAKDLDEYWNEAGIDYGKISETITGELVAGLDAAIKSGRISEYKKFLDEASKSNKEFVESLIGANDAFAALSKLPLEAIINLEELGLTLDEINLILGALGDRVDEFKIEDIISDKDSSNITKKGEIIKDAIKGVQDELEDFLKDDKYSEENLKKLREEADDAQEAYQDYATMIDRKQITGKKIKDKELDELERLEKAFLAASDAANEVDNEIAKADDQINSLLNSFNQTPATTLQDNMKALTSSLQRLNEFDTMSFADRMKFVEDYPEFTDAMARGYATAEEEFNFAAGKYRDTLQEHQDQMEVIQAKYVAQSGKKGFEFSARVAIDLADGALTGKSISEIQSRYGITEAEAQSVYADVFAYDYSKSSKSYLESKGMVGMLDSNALAAFQDATNLLNKYRAELTALDKTMADMNKESDEYAKAMAKRNIILSNIAEAAKQELSSLVAELNSKTGLDLQTLIDDSIVSFAGGVFGIDEDKLNKLDEKTKFQLLRNYGLFQQYAKDIDGLNTQITDSHRELAQAVIDAKNQETQAIIDNIKEQKKAYENYYKELDELEKTEEREASRESILRQLSVLAGGVDGASKAKVKELQKELNALNKEEVKARRDEQRNELMKSLDGSIEGLEGSMETLNKSLWELMQVIAIEGYKPDFDSILGDMGGYAQGGVSGITTNPINNPGNYTNNSNSVTVGSITITTQQLNTLQDFGHAGKELATAFYDTIFGRGIPSSGNR